MSDALRRRCLYHYLDYPDAQRERDIVKARLPDIDHHLNYQLVEVVQKLRGASLRKAPGVAETLDWAAALMQLDVNDLAQSIEQVHQSLACLIKTHEDLALIRRDDAGFAELIGMTSKA